MLAASLLILKDSMTIRHAKNKSEYNSDCTSRFKSNRL